MKKINVVITRLQQTEMVVADDFDINNPDFSDDETEYLDFRSDKDEIVIESHVELVEGEP